MQFNNDDEKDNRPQLNESTFSCFLLLPFCHHWEFFQPCLFSLSTFLNCLEKGNLSKIYKCLCAFFYLAVFMMNVIHDIICCDDCQNLSDFGLFKGGLTGTWEEKVFRICRPDCCPILLTKGVFCPIIVPKANPPPLDGYFRGFFLPYFLHCGICLQYFCWFVWVLLFLQKRMSATKL